MMTKLNPAAKWCLLGYWHDFQSVPRKIPWCLECQFPTNRESAPWLLPQRLNHIAASVVPRVADNRISPKTFK
jgi:hypothetical protein